MGSIRRAAFIWLITAVLLFASFVLQSEKTSAGTSVGGSISTDTNWTVDGSPYDVIDNITVENGATLTIEAGVQVIFNDRNYILVNGTLRSLGRSDRKVVFMPFQPFVIWEGLIVTRYGHLELRNSTIFGAHHGVSMAEGSENNIITGNYFDGNDGIEARGGNHLIESNTFVGIPGEGAIHMWSLSYNFTIRGNRFIGLGGIGARGDGHIIEDNYFESVTGIEAAGLSNATIRNNVFLAPIISISIALGSKDNEIYGNWIEGSTFYAIWLNCTGCRVWNNSFMGNVIMFGTSQAVDGNGLSHWNESYPIGGNYWSDYGGPDMFNGPGQNIPGSDGIGDIPYPIYDSTFDYYPLVDYTPPMPDLVVTEEEIVFDPPDPVQEGESVDIYAAIRNTGMANAINVVVRFFDGDPGSGVQIDGDQTIGLLSLGGGKEWVKVTWTANGIGQHQICVLADPDDLVKESDEGNNQACKSIDVTQAGPPSPPSDLRAHLSGVDRENVTLTWSLSPDDSGGKNNVVRYDIHRGENHSSNISAYYLHDSVPNATSEYVDAGAGEGDPGNHFYRVCAVDLSNNSACAEDQAAKFTHSLTRGPSLISIPLIQSNESIETVLQTVEYDRAWSYDSASQEWKWYMKSKGYRRGLFNINQTMGMWVNVTEDSNLTVAGLVPTVTTINLSEGWNLVGFPSFNSTYPLSYLKAEVGATRAEGHDPSLPPFYLRVYGDAEVLQTGEAYWVKVDADMDWIIEVS